MCPVSQPQATHACAVRCCCFAGFKDRPCCRTVLRPAHSAQDSPFLPYAGLVSGGGTTRQHDANDAWQSLPVCCLVLQVASLLTVAQLKDLEAAQVCACVRVCDLHVRVRVRVRMCVHMHMCASACARTVWVPCRSSLHASCHSIITRACLHARRPGPVHGGTRQQGSPVQGVLCRTVLCRTVPYLPCATCRCWPSRPRAPKDRQHAAPGRASRQAAAAASSRGPTQKPLLPQRPAAGARPARSGGCAERPAALRT